MNRQLTSVQMRQQLISKNFEPALELTGWSMDEIQIIKKYGSWFSALTQGVALPETELQRHFVLVGQGLVAPTTKYEIAWRKYLLFKHENREKLEEEKIKRTSRVVDALRRNTLTYLQIEMILSNLDRFELDHEQVELLRSKINR